MSIDERTADRASTEQTEVDDFLVAHGGPFYELQRQLGLLREGAFRAPLRAMLAVGLAWGVPLLLSIIAGDAFGPVAERPYLLDPSPWARFFIAIGLFILMERLVEERLRTNLREFVSAPLLAPGSFEPAAEAVTRALKRRDSVIAEIVCLILALIISFAPALRTVEATTSTWLVHLSADGGHAVTAAAWWCVVVSSPMLWFLLLRWLYRHFVWAGLLRDIAGLDMRLVVTHPDGYGGLAFLGEYPNVYAAFVFAVSCIVGAAVAHELLQGDLSPTNYGYVMAAWLAVILALFAYPLLAFSKPLSRLKQETMRLCSVQATRHHRAAERELLGKNIFATDDAEKTPAKDIPNPSAMFASAQKMSTLLIRRTALVPVSAAALLPLAAAGLTQLPIKQIFGVIKRLLLF